MNISLFSRYAFFVLCALTSLLCLPFLNHPWVWPLFEIAALLTLVGIRDLRQCQHAVRRK